MAYHMRRYLQRDGGAMRDNHDPGTLDLENGRLSIGYARVSTDDQDLRNQRHELHAADCSHNRGGRPGGHRRRGRTTMTNDHEPRVRELSRAEIEALRQEMRQSVEWAKNELARRTDTTDK